MPRRKLKDKLRLEFARLQDTGYAPSYEVWLADKVGEILQPVLGKRNQIEAQLFVVRKEYVEKVSDIRLRLRAASAELRRIVRALADDEDMAAAAEAYIGSQNAYDDWPDEPEE